MLAMIPSLDERLRVSCNEKTEALEKIQKLYGNFNKTYRKTAKKIFLCRFKPNLALYLLSSYVYGVFGAQRSRDCNVTVLVSQI